MKSILQQTIMTLLFATIANVSLQAQFDDLYYDPNTEDATYYTDLDDESFHSNETSYSEYGESDYDDSDYEYYDDYDYNYTNRIRRFRRGGNFNRGYYSNFNRRASRWNDPFYDPFYDPYTFGGSFINNSFSRPYGYAGYGSFNSWNRWNSWGGNNWCGNGYNGFGYGGGNYIVNNYYGNNGFNGNGGYANNNNYTNVRTFGSRKGESTTSSTRGKNPNSGRVSTSGTNNNPTMTGGQTRGNEVITGTKSVGTRDDGIKTTTRSTRPSIYKRDRSTSTRSRTDRSESSTKVNSRTGNSTKNKANSSKRKTFNSNTRSKSNRSSTSSRSNRSQTKSNTSSRTSKSYNTRSGGGSSSRKSSSSSRSSKRGGKR